MTLESDCFFVVWRLLTVCVFVLIEADSPNLGDYNDLIMISPFSF